MEEGYEYSQAEEKAAKKTKATTGKTSASSNQHILEKLKALVKSDEPLLVFQKVQISKEDNKIFGSVSWTDIKTALFEKFKIDCPREVFPAEGLRIKEIGLHQVVLGGGGDKDAQLTIAVQVIAI